VERVVIVGGGLAAATAVGELRERGYTGRLDVVAAEAHTPYERPPLSKGYLLGKDGVEAIYPKPTDWYAEHDVALTTGVRAIGLGDHVVTLASGTELPFDRLLLATGAVPRQLALP
jgi:NADPH-dependent 2,4-dienoyl-CoA reductase/sulfur reductase-like enzyme